MKVCRLMQDDDGHWYVIPIGSIERFNTIMHDLQSYDQEDWYQPDLNWLENHRVDSPNSINFIQVEL